MKQTIAQSAMEFAESEELKSIFRASGKITKHMESDEKGYDECLELFFKIFTKLNPRKKILDMNISPKYSTKKIVLHQFGLFMLHEGDQRCKPMDKEQLFEFFKDNTPETFDKIADEISYKHIRIAFRDFCKMMHNFIKEGGHMNVNGDSEFIEEKASCKNKEIITADLQKCKINHFTMTASNNGIEISFDTHKIDNIIFTTDSDGKEEEIGLDYLIIVEQVIGELTKAVKIISEKVDERLKGKHSVSRLHNELREKFSNFIVADEL